MYQFDDDDEADANRPFAQLQVLFASCSFLIVWWFRFRLYFLCERE
jgi:hypothetical protein